MKRSVGLMCGIGLLCVFSTAFAEVDSPYGIARALEREAEQRLLEEGVEVFSSWYKDFDEVGGNRVIFHDPPPLSLLRLVTHFQDPYRLDLISLKLELHHLKALVLLKDLEVLNLVGCSLPKGTEAYLRKNLSPDVELSIRKGGSLGIHVWENKRKELWVDLVGHHWYKEQSRIQVNDRLLSINGQKVSTMADFVRAESQIGNLDTFTAEVLREDEVIKITMEAVSWSEMEDEFEFNFYE